MNESFPTLEELLKSIEINRGYDHFYIMEEIWLSIEIYSDAEYKIEVKSDWVYSGGLEKFYKVEFSSRIIDRYNYVLKTFLLEHYNDIKDHYFSNKLKDKLNEETISI